MCTKNGNYCENEKKRKSQGEGGFVQRMEVIVQRKKSGGGSQGRCERRSENSKKSFYFFIGGGVRLGGQSGCEWRSEAFVKIQKKNRGGGGGRVGLGGGGSGVRVYVDGEVKLL